MVLVTAEGTTAAVAQEQREAEDSHTRVPKYTDRDILDMYMAEADAP